MATSGLVKVLLAIWLVQLTAADEPNFFGRQASANAKLWTTAKVVTVPTTNPSGAVTSGPNCAGLFPRLQPIQFPTVAFKTPRFSRLPDSSSSSLPGNGGHIHPYELSTRAPLRTFFMPPSVTLWPPIASSRPAFARTPLDHKPINESLLVRRPGSRLLV